MATSPAPRRQPAYPRVADKPDFPGLEREVLAYWAQDGTFEASIKARTEAEARSAELEARVTQAEAQVQAQSPVVEQLQNELNALRAESVTEQRR